MPLKDRTKELFAHELEAMMSSMPLSKVRVGDLCARCGTGRQTFYYHFRDKYDVVAWVFEQDYLRAEAAVGSSDPVAVVADALTRMWERRPFYREAFADKSQNSISEYIQEFDVRLMGDLLAQRRGIDPGELTVWELFAIKHHSYGSISCTLEWLRGEIQATPAQLAAWEFACMPGFLREAYGLTV